MLVSRTQSTVGSDKNIRWHVTEMTIVTILNDMCTCTLVCVQILILIFWFECERQLLKMWKKIDVIILYGIYMINVILLLMMMSLHLMVDASNILVVFLPILYDFLQQFLILLLVECSWWHSMINKYSDAVE